MRNLFKTKDDEDIIYDPNDERLDFNILYLTHYYDPDKRVRQRSGRRAHCFHSCVPDHFGCVAVEVGCHHLNTTDYLLKNEEPCSPNH